MHFLSIASLFPPDTVGGAQQSASNLARWLARQGHKVTVLTAAKSRSDQSEIEIENGVTVWRRYLPRPYPIYQFEQAAQWLKPIWHLQDHIDPRNKAVVAEALDSAKPDGVLIHFLQGFGYNTLEEIAKRNIPSIYFLHDLGLACVRMSMFRNGADCPTWCGTCKLSTRFKVAHMEKVPRIGLCSPSRANLSKLGEFFPVDHFPNTSIPNANRYPGPTIARSESDKIRFLYVGRLHSSKGVPLLLEAAAGLPDKDAFTLTIIGGGPDEAELREKYGSAPWVRFTGFISQQDISNEMQQSDLLCIPSIWQENSPGVVIHALGQGLPVFGSAKGGIGELVDHEKNGLLLPTGDLGAWRSAMHDVIKDRTLLGRWTQYAHEHSSDFDQDTFGNRILSFFKTVGLSDRNIERS